MKAIQQTNDRHRTRSGTHEPDTQYRLLFESNPRPLFVFAKSSLRILALNRAMVRLYGWSCAEILQMRATDIFHPGDIPRLRAALKAQSGAVTAFVGEWQHRRKDGSLFNAEVDVGAIKFGGIPAGLTLIDDVTRRKRTETALHEERDRLSALIRSICDEVWYADTEGHFTLVNPRGRREFGLPPKGPANVRQLAGRIEVLRPDGTPRPVEEAPPLRALRGEIVTDQEEIIRTPATREFRHRQVSAAPVRDVSGNIVGSVSIVRDITQHKRTEAALRDGEERYRLAVDFTYDWEYWLDPRGRLVYVSPACKRITGYTSTEFRAKPGLMRRLLRPADRARYDAHISVCEQKRKPGEDEWQIRHRKGGSRWIGHVCQPVFNDRGDFLGIRGSNRDITDRKLAEEALRTAQAQLEQRVLDRTAQLQASERRLAESEERFRQMAENVQEVFWLADVNFRRMLYVSPAFATVWGRSCKELYRRPQLWANAVHPADRGLVRAAFFHKRHGKAPLEAEYRIIRPDGTVRWIADHGSQVRDEAGRVYRIAGVARDVTEAKNVELALMRADRALRAITACGEALLRSTCEEDLYERVCRIIVDTGGYRMAWIGLAEDDAHRQVRPVAWAGEGCSYLLKATIVWSDTRRGRGPTGTAIRTGQPNVCRNMMEDSRLAPWREDARQHGYGSSVAVPLLIEGRSFGALTIYASEPMEFDADEVKMLMQFASDVAFGVTALRTQAARQRLEQQLVNISEREQRRIGQDLHDGLGQRIASARLTCAAVAHRLARDRHVSARSALRVEKELARALEETRHIARGLHPVKPGADALMSALYELAASITKMSRIPCRFICKRPVLFSDHAAATHLYRITQEAVNNAIRHARAKHIQIGLAHVNGHVHLRIADDGLGLRAGTKPCTGLGLEIMRYRASVIGAHFTITSQPGHGTVVTCELTAGSPADAPNLKSEGRDLHVAQSSASC